jgi:Amt family ammonium transporter
MLARVSAWLLCLVALLACLSFTQAAGAQAQQPAAAVEQAPKLDTGDTAWMLISTALVLMMTIPGLALFYGGLVRSKNVLSTLMHSLFCAALISVVWVVVGYSLAFGPSQGGWIGNLDFLGMKGVVGGKPSDLAKSIPLGLFVMYQLTFAVITPALISGSFAERMRFAAFAIMMLLWSLFIYAPLAHWVWGGGWIGTKLGALDFAGGTVVHISSGASALVCALYLGKRQGYGSEPMPPHNLPFTLIGAGLLWVGWFGFNAGSALGSNELASTAMLNTNTAAAGAALSWLFMELVRSKHATILGAASGAVAGLVVITPAAGFVSPMAALAMGLMGGVVCYFAVGLKPRFGYDDALDVVGVHFVGGTLGAILTGVFATSKVNPAITDLTAGGSAKDATSIIGSLPGGLIEGHASLVLAQLLAVLATIALAAVGTLAILFIVNLITPVRAKADDEILGMDLSQHRERAYAIGGGDALSAAASVMADPKSAAQPPTQASRFTVVLEGVNEQAAIERWRSLCLQRDSAPGVAFTSVYSQLSTVRHLRFRFRAGDREQIRANLERLFADMGPNVKARIE